MWQSRSSSKKVARALYKTVQPFCVTGHWCREVEDGPIPPSPRAIRRRWWWLEGEQGGGGGGERGGGGEVVSMRTLDKGFDIWNWFQKYSTLKFELVAMLHVQQRKVLVKFQFIYLFILPWNQSFRFKILKKQFLIILEKFIQLFSISHTETKFVDGNHCQWKLILYKSCLMGACLVQLLR